MSVRFGLRLLVVCLALASLGQVASAQAKIAIINLQKAVLDSDEIQKASKALEAKFKPRQQELEKLQNEIQVIQQQPQHAIRVRIQQIQLLPQAHFCYNGHRINGQHFDGWQHQHQKLLSLQQQTTE